ncbi:MAG: FGGY-family carbohydrate kinase [Chloroflexi bacterium]|uniref:FGGY-family carbohydrate kinase n=1 Tax=Candidatus Chlorohelix allophototropha TaxID=3003348 RepID=A0A8T7LY16_9CHLR|nr:FGGY-family carbohydrate kinase [Chloroflexota bacterium]WJW66184.1 FGGY-family carbohydrate kinase [Chloroflexota bacterium L227-S17]
MSGELVLGIDIGTYSSKGVLCDASGKVLATRAVEHGLSLPKPGWAEQDGETIWWSDFIKLCRSLPSEAGCSPEEIAAVAVSGLGPDLLPLDEKSRPLRPAILYGIDTRAYNEIEQLNRQFGEQELYELSGMALTSQAIGPKLLWLKNNEPEIYRQTRYITSCSSYLVQRLTGEYVLDYHTASHFNPLFDIRNLKWTDRFAEPIWDVEKLPRLAWATEIGGQVTTQASKETGLKSGTPVTTGTIDAVAEALSVGVVEPGDMMLMYGTTFFFILVAEKPVTDPRMWLTAYANSGNYAVAGGMSTTGALTRWFRDQLAPDLLAAEQKGGAPAYAILSEEAGHVPPGARGLLVLPHFQGERTPIHDPHARGLFAGLTLTHTRTEMYRAVLEATAYGVNQNLQVMQEMGAKPKRLVAVGGGAKSKTWLQIVSDVTGTSQDVPQQIIGASYGDAFLAAYASGLVKDFDTLSKVWVGTPARIEPDAKNHALYNEYYDLFLQMYRQTSEISHRLARLGAQDF